MVNPLEDKGFQAWLSMQQKKPAAPTKKVYENPSAKKVYGTSQNTLAQSWRGNYLKPLSKKKYGSTYDDKFSNFVKAQGGTDEDAEGFRYWMNKRAAGLKQAENEMEKKQQHQRQVDAYLEDPEAIAATRKKNEASIKQQIAARTPKKTTSDKVKGGLAKTLKAIETGAEIIDRPGDAVRSGISNLMKGKSFTKGLKEGFTGKQNTSGTQLNDKLANKLGLDTKKSKVDDFANQLTSRLALGGMPGGYALSSLIGKKGNEKVGKELLGMATETALDPTNLLEVGGLLKGIKALDKGKTGLKAASEVATKVDDVADVAKKAEILGLPEPQLSIPAPVKPKPNLETFQNIFKPINGLESPIPEMPTPMRQKLNEINLKNQGVDFGYNTKIEPKARHNRTPIETPVDHLDRGQAYWQKRYEDFAKQVNENYDMNQMSQEALEDLWSQFAHYDEPIKLEQAVELAYPKGFEAPPVPKPEPPTPPIIEALKGDDRINELIKGFHPDIKPEPKISRPATFQEIADLLKELAPPKPPEQPLEPLQFRRLAGGMETQAIQPTSLDRKVTSFKEEFEQVVKQQADKLKKSHINASDEELKATVQSQMKGWKPAALTKIEKQIARLNKTLAKSPEKAKAIKPTLQSLEKEKKEMEDALLKLDLQFFGQKEQKAQVSKLLNGDKLNMLKGNKSNTVAKQEEQIILSQNKTPFDLKRNLSKLYQNTFDSQNLIGKISNEAKVNASNSRQTQGIVDFIMEHGLVDKNGVKTGESLTELTQGLPLNKENEFWRYLAHQHNVARAAEGKNVFSQFNSSQSKLEAQKILSQNPEFKEIGKKVTNWINTFMDTWAKDLVGEDTLKMWKSMYPDYFPVYRDMDPLKQVSFNNAKRGYVNHHNLVKKAKGAKADLSSSIKDPIGNIIQLVNKTVKAEKNNQVGLAILDEVKKGNLDDIFEIVSTKEGFIDDINITLKEEGLEGVMEKFTGQFDDVFKQIEKGNNIVKIMDNGKQVLLKVKDMDYLKALQSLSDGTGMSAAEQFEKAARRVARPIKELITGKNPLFAIFNFMRDTPMAFIQGQEDNVIKFTGRYFRALKEIAHNSKGFQEFAAQGGMQSGFFKNDVLKMSTQLKNPKASPLQKIMYQVEAFNNLIESTPRYMEYLATLEKGGTKAQAIYNAAEVTTNFARSGKWGKFFDSFVLYLNPALQGLDKFVRQVKSRPLQTALKAAGIITVPQVITDFVNNDNPNYQALDQRLKDDFFLIPNKFGPTDEQGNAETFFRIPKTRQYSLIFAVLVNRIGELTRGTSIKDASKGIVGAFDRNFSIPTRPIWSPFSDVARNKDWKDAPINPLGMELDGRSNYLKYDEKTSEIGKVLAKMLNEQPIEGIKYSPKDIDYIIDSFTGIIGDVVLPAATKSESLSGIPKKKFIADSVYSNQEITNFYDNLQASRNKAADVNILGNIPSSSVTDEESQRNTLNKISRDMSGLNKQIKQETDEKRQRALRQQMNELARKGNAYYGQYQK